MKKKQVVLLLLVAAFLVSSLLDGVVCAADATLEVRKAAGNDAINVGDAVTVLLKFSNPFGRQLAIRIVDKNVFGNSGLDVQCLEYTLPNQSEVNVAYDPITPLSAGRYTLDAAEITYTNPVTGKSETVRSNELELSVAAGSNNTQPGQTQGLTTMYRCDGVNMQSTSYSSSLSGQQQTQPNQQQQQEQQESAANQRVQNNQMNQNAQAVKQQLGEQLARQNQMGREFQQNLAKNQEFREKHEELLKAGYSVADGSFDTSTNDTGSFGLTYKKQDGEGASMKGEMENGSVKELMVQTDRDVQEMLEQLHQNGQFRKYVRQLAEKGFNQTQPPTINQVSQNRTEMAAPYKNSEGAERKITAEYVNGTIRNVSLEPDDEKGSWWLLLMIPLMAALGWTVYSKLKRNRNDGQKIVETKIERDYAKEAVEMIAEAERLFGNNREKDAYEKVSQAVRFYFSHRLGIGCEVTNTEILAVLKSRKERKLHFEVQECLSLCGLVEFAKYEPNRQDFGKLATSARDFILTNRGSQPPASRR